MNLKINWLRFLVIFLIPIGITSLLFPPLKKVKINIAPEDDYTITQAYIDNELSRSFVAEIIQMSTRINKYDLCVKSNDYVKVDNEEIKPNINNEGGLFWVWITKIYDTLDILDSEQVKLSVNPGEKRCVTFFNDGVGFTIGKFSVSPLILKEIASNIKEENDTESSRIDVFIKDYDFYIKNNKTSLFLKYLTLLLIWSGVVVLMREVKNFVFKK